MEISLTTPALLFPAISLLMVAYTNRFMTVGARIRNLSRQYKEHPEQVLYDQVVNLRQRVFLIRNMQAFGMASLFSTVFCMLILFIGNVLVGHIFFGLSLFLMLISLGLSLREILISVRALDLELSSLEGRLK